MDSDTLVSPQSVDGDSPQAIECTEPGCDFVAEGPRAKFNLGAHRLRAHGIRGQSNRTERRRKSPTPPKPKAPSVKQQVKQNSEITYGFVGLVSTPILPNFGTACQQNAPAIGNTWAACSDEEWVRNFWMMGGEVTKYAALVMAHLPLVVALFTDLQMRQAVRMQRQQEPPVTTEGAPIGEPVTGAAA